jgi:N-acyl-D-aspartate/D-glutamate deacylase
MPFDILIRGGRLIDGTGTPARAADIAIEGDGSRRSATCPRC